MSLAEKSTEGFRQGGEGNNSEHHFRKILLQCGLKKEAEKRGLQKHLFSYFRTKA